MFYWFLEEAEQLWKKLKRALVGCFGAEKQKAKKGNGAEGKACRKS